VPGGRGDQTVQVATTGLASRAVTRTDVGAGSSLRMDRESVAGRLGLKGGETDMPNRPYERHSEPFFAPQVMHQVLSCSGSMDRCPR
jgi:hypothetical protein